MAYKQRSPVTSMRTSPIFLVVLFSPLVNCEFEENWGKKDFLALSPKIVQVNIQPLKNAH